MQPNEIGSPPGDSILFSPSILPQEVFWYSRATSVSLNIFILKRCAIEALVFSVDSLGYLSISFSFPFSLLITVLSYICDRYTPVDCPKIVISSGNVLEEMEEVATWNLRELYEGNIEPLTQLRYEFETRVSSRIIRLQFDISEGVKSGLSWTFFFFLKKRN